MRIQRDFVILGVAGFALLTASSANAQLTRTWVSSTGNDSNPCSRSLPCADFAAAIGMTTAGGTVNVVDPGDYGAVIISHSITIDGGGVGGNITSTGAVAISIDAATTDTVILRNLSLDGAGQGSDGIFLGSANYLVIENCSIRGFTSIDIGIGSGSAQHVSIKNTTITGGQIGVRVFQGPGPVTATLRDMTITGATEIAIFVRSGVLDVSYSTLSQNDVALANDTVGFITAESNMIAYNQTAVQTTAGCKTFLSNNDLVANVNPISASGGGIVGTAGNNRKDDNTNPGATNGVFNIF